MQKLTSRRYRFEPFEVDFGTAELRRRGIRLKLSGQPLQILEMLLERPGEVVSREELRQLLWEDDTFVDFERGLNAAVNRLREALGDSAAKPRYIETLPRLGYRFIASVSGPSAQQQLPSATISLAAETSGHLIEPSPANVPSPATSAQTEFPLAPSGTAVDTAPVTGSKALGDSLSPDNAPMPRARTPGTGTPKLRWLLFAACLGLAAILGLWTRHRLLHAEEPIRSLAVLPLDDMSPGAREDYFADGMTDELITELAHIPGLRVVSRTSVMQDKGARKSLAQIARKLDVDAIVEGSVVRSGDRVRITAQLIDARSDKHLWAQSFEGPLGDILSLQDDVAREISRRTSAALTPAARAGLTNAKHVDPDAYDAYLRGLYFIQRRDGDLAASYFRKAIALDPEYAAANAGLAEALVTQFLVDAASSAALMPSASEAARRSIELDPYSGEAYTALGAIETTYLYDWTAAEKNLRKGIELSPSSSDAETWYAVYLTSVGRPGEAVDAMRRAVALNPLSFWANRLLGSMLYYSRRYDESLVALKRALELAPDKVGFVEAWNSDNYEMLGRYGDALAADIKDMGSELTPRDILSFHSAFETGGWDGYQKARVRYLLHGSLGQCYMNPLALSYIRLGNMDEAFRWLKRDLDNRCGTAVFDLASDPRLDKLRPDPRFTALLHRANLPPKP
jgi:TolB-like protein/DNA-binding winged helix-turn-helix (wHTH) protein/Tfp pilus assembly protein PilF